jgi:hypothetical protein
MSLALAAVNGPPLIASPWDRIRSIAEAITSRFDAAGRIRSNLVSLPAGALFGTGLQPAGNWS